MKGVFKRNTLKKAMALEIGDTFINDYSPGIVYRVVEITDTIVYIISLSGSITEIPREWSTIDFYWLQDTNSIRKVKDPADEKPDYDDYTYYQECESEKRWEAIGKRWIDPEVRPRFLSKSQRTPLINKIGSELGISGGQVRRLLTNFWRGGMNKKSLVPEKKKLRKKKPAPKDE